MILTIKGSSIKPRKKYLGFITGHAVDKKKMILRVFVTLDAEPDVEYMQVIPISHNQNSKFASFAKRMGIFTEDGKVDTDSLNDLAVEAILARGKDGTLYVNHISIDYEYYENECAAYMDEEEACNKFNRDEGEDCDDDEE